MSPSLPERPSRSLTRPRLRGRSLAARIGLAVLVIELGVLGLGGALLIDLFTREIRQQIAARMVIPGTLMETGGLSLRAAGDLAVMRALVGERTAAAMLLGINGVVLQSTDPWLVGLPAADLVPPDLLAAAQAGGISGLAPAELAPVWRRQGGQQLVEHMAPLHLEGSSKPLFYLYLRFDASEVAETQRQVLVVLAGALVLAAVLTSAIIQVVLRREVISPLHRMTEAVQRIGGGDLAVRSRSGVGGDLAFLETGLNAMADAIETNARALQAVNLDLERRYDARTRDLQRALKVRLEVEEQLRQARDMAEEALVAKSRFLAAASHDLRQPVHTLRLLLAAVRTELDRGGELLPLLSEMEQASGNLADLLNSLLDISRLEAGAVVPVRRAVALDEVLAEVGNRFRRVADAADVELAVVSCSAVVWTDPALLSRMLANLVDNAIKFSPHGKVLVGCRRRGPEIALQVLDTGIGIPPDMREAVFAEFRQIGNQARQMSKGLGLGLSIVRRTATLLGHRLGLSSHEGRGTVFTLELPLARGGEAPATTSARGTRSPR